MSNVKCSECRAVTGRGDSRWMHFGPCGNPAKGDSYTTDGGHLVGLCGRHASWLKRKGRVEIYGPAVPKKSAFEHQHYEWHEYVVDENALREIAEAEKRERERKNEAWEMGHYRAVAGLSGLTVEEVLERCPRLPKDKKS